MKGAINATAANGLVEYVNQQVADENEALIEAFAQIAFVDIKRAARRGCKKVIVYTYPHLRNGLMDELQRWGYTVTEMTERTRIVPNRLLVEW